MDSELSSRRTSKIWKHYKNKGNYIATCLVCKHDYSYKSSISNLTKHIKRKHGMLINDKEGEYGNDTTDCSDDDTSIHSTEPKNKDTTSSSTWQYFEVLDSDQFVAKCKICDKEIAYDSVSELTAHVKEHNALVSDDEDWVDKNTDSNDKMRPLKSPVWQYMQVISREGKIAVCLLCKKQLSYAATPSNLKKHLVHKHNLNHLKENNVDNPKHMIISTDGQLYEIATSDGEKDPIQTDAVYLEDSLDCDNFDTVQTIETKMSTPKRMKFLHKKHHKKDIPKEIYRNTYTSIDNTKNTCTNTRRISNTSSTNRLDLFGEYILSLLRELPTHVSDQLQSDIIKQIFTAKMALEMPYSVTTNTEPVTVTISKSNSYNMPEITVHNGNVGSEVEVNVNEEKNEEKSDIVMQNGH